MLKRYLQLFLSILLLIFFFTSCREKEWDKFYGRPDSLAPPIYKVLKSKGHFNEILKCIDKAGYKRILGNAGYWTFFAPNDSAFNAYFKERGIDGIKDIDSSSARDIVQWLLVFNKYKKVRLDDYQSTKNDAGWVMDDAFRRGTAYYNDFYQTSDAEGKEIVAIADNRNNSGGEIGNYVSADHNNKFITYFTDNYFDKYALSSVDYNYFFPTSQYTGFNVEGAKVITKDILAENGVIHEINKVLTPPKSIDEYLRNNTNYSKFWSILNRFNINRTVQYIYSPDATHRHEILTGKSDSVFVKVYSSQLAYSPDNENFLKEEVNDGQKDCWTMFAPNNQAVEKFVKQVLLKYYSSLDDMPVSIINDFLNAQMFPTAVWPSKFGVTYNNFGESAGDLDPYGDIKDKKILSNGFFYGTDKVISPDVFSTVYGEAYLNPSFTMMTKLFQIADLKLRIANSIVPVDIFLIPDSIFHRVGYSYNESKEQFEYRPPGSSHSTTNSVKDDLTRMVKTCVFFDPYKGEIDDLSGSGIVKSGTEGSEGEYIKYNNNTIQTSGLMDKGEVAHVTETKLASNGKVYYLDKLPVFSEENVGYHLKQIAEEPGSEFSYFYQYLKNSIIYNPDQNSIIGLSGFSTVFVPDNDAIVQAVQDGILPGTENNPDFDPSSSKDKQDVQNFIKYHILDGHTVIPDGRSNQTYKTFLKDQMGDNLEVDIRGGRGNMIITDNHGREANVILSQSNHLSNRSVIHLIDNYLQH